MPLIDLSDAVNVAEGYRDRNPDMWSLCNSIKFDIAELPTISPDDVRGVGQPVKIFNDPWTGKMFTTCSRCDGKISPKDCYCKHCGARMKGAEDETTDNA